MSTGYNILVMLHLLSVIGGFGAVAYNALYLNLARRQAAAEGSRAVVEVNTVVTGLAELLIYSALVFGIGAVTASHGVYKFSQAWVSAAFGVYIVDIAILHGWIRRHQRRYALVANRLEASGPDSRPTQALAELQDLDRRISIGWGAFNLLVVGAVYLMVFKPGA